MKHPLESLMTAAGILLMALLIRFFAARPLRSRPCAGAKLVGIFIWRISNPALYLFVVLFMVS